MKIPISSILYIKVKNGVQNCVICCNRRGSPTIQMQVNKNILFGLYNVKDCIDIMFASETSLVIRTSDGRRARYSLVWCCHAQNAVYCNGSLHCICEIKLGQNAMVPH